MTTTTTRKRVHKGRPTGGQFAATDRPAADVNLAPPIDAAAVHENPHNFHDLALDAETSPETLDSLVDADHWMVNFWVAANPAITQATQERLAAYPDSGVLSHLIGNPSVTAETLHVLARNKYRDIRTMVAASPSVSADDLAMLASDDDIYVLAQVTANPRTPRAVIEELARHPRFLYIREQAGKRLAA